MADALLRAGLASKERIAELERERRKADKQQLDANLQRLLTPKTQRNPNETQES